MSCALILALLLIGGVHPNPGPPPSQPNLPRSQSPVSFTQAFNQPQTIRICHVVQAASVSSQNSYPSQAPTHPSQPQVPPSSQPQRLPTGQPQNLPTSPPFTQSLKQQSSQSIFLPPSQPFNQSSDQNNNLPPSQPSNLLSSQTNNLPLVNLPISRLVRLIRILLVSLQTCFQINLTVYLLVIRF
jgi:hypothetical protein